jgi:putative flippase GtrA
VTVLRNPVLLRFVAVNAVNTGVYYLVYLAFLLVVPYVAANVAALVVAIALAYVANARWTFQVELTGRSLVAFAAGNLTTTVLRTSVLWLLVEGAGMGERVAPVLATALTLPVAFALTRLAMGDRGLRTPARPVTVGAGS